MMYSIRSVLHMAVITVWVVTVTIVLGTAAIFVAFFSKKGNVAHLLARTWGKSILWVSAVAVDVQGREHLRRTASCILMPNHQSNFDIPVLLGCLPVQFRWLAKKELFNIPLFGRSMRGCGYISIDRSDRRAAFKSLATAAQRIRQGVSVLIFPEGTRSRDGRILPFKKGGFVLAVDAGVPVVPIVIHGTRRIMPKGRFLVQSGPVVMKILPPIDTRAYTRKTKENLMQAVHAAISGALDKMEPECR